MNEYPNIESRFKLEEAKYFYGQMDFFLQSFKTESAPTKYLYYIDAFLAAARSVTHIFKTEFHDNEPLMKWYEYKVEEWEKNKIMRLFIEMRNVSLKEETPKPITIVADAQRFDLSKALIKVSPNGKIEQIAIPIRQPTEKGKPENKPAKEGISVFYSLPKWFDETPDVMYLCKAYLDELEKFATEAESMIEKRG